MSFVSKANEKRAVFIDRDGVINHDLGYVFKWEDFKFIDGAIDAMQMLIKESFLLFIITNQSGIGRGYYSDIDLLLLNKVLCEYLNFNNVKIEEIYYCPHLPEEKCACRKPSPGLILQAEREHAINLRRSFMIGDKLSDVKAGLRAGVGTNILIHQYATPKKQQDLNYSTAKDLYEAAAQIIDEAANR
ncbi:MAG: HAD family hydrolase [Sphingomonadaceae bacterium]|nr:HAD family hydrolase [Sphingomonadaceae bacterium]